MFLRHPQIEEQLPIRAELRDGQCPAPPYENVAVRQHLHVACSVGVLLFGVGVLPHQRGAHPFLVELEHDGAGLLYRFGGAVLKEQAPVIEDAYGPIGQAPSVVLEGESGAGTHLEVALLAAQAPDDLSRLSVYLVDGRGLAGGDQQVVVVVHVYGVEVEVVDAGTAILQKRSIGLLKAHMVEALPFEEQLSGLDVQLLHDALPRYAVLPTAEGAEVPRHRVVDRDQGGVLWADEKLVMVPVV